MPTDLPTAVRASLQAADARILPSPDLRASVADRITRRPRRERRTQVGLALATVVLVALAVVAFWPTADRQEVDLADPPPATPTFTPPPTPATTPTPAPTPTPPPDPATTPHDQATTPPVPATTQPPQVQGTLLIDGTREPISSLCETPAGVITATFGPSGVLEVDRTVAPSAPTVRWATAAGTAATDDVEVDYTEDTDTYTATFPNPGGEVPTTAAFTTNVEVPLCDG